MTFIGHLILASEQMESYRKGNVAELTVWRNWRKCSPTKHVVRLAEAITAVRHLENARMPFDSKRCGVTRWEIPT